MTGYFPAQRMFLPDLIRIRQAIEQYETEHGPLTATHRRYLLTGETPA